MFKLTKSVLSRYVSNLRIVVRVALKAAVSRVQAAGVSGCAAILLWVILLHHTLLPCALMLIVTITLLKL